MRRSVRTVASVILCSLATALLLTGCAAAPGPAVDLAATEAAIRAEVLATVTAEAPTPSASSEATATTEPSGTPMPAATDAPTSTLEPTGTPPVAAASTETPFPEADYTPVPATVGSTQEPSSSQPSTYTVQAGDSLSKVASTVGVSVAALAAYNGIADAGSIYVGQIIQIPPEDYVVPTSAPTRVPTASAVTETAPSTSPTATPATTDTPTVQVQFSNLHYECQMRCMGGDSPVWSYRSLQVLMTIVNTTPNRTVEAPWYPTRWVITDGVNSRTDDLVFVWYGPGGQAYKQPSIPPGGAVEWTFAYPTLAEPEWVSAIEFELWGRVYRQEFNIGSAKTLHNYTAVCGTIPLDTSCGR